MSVIQEFKQFALRGNVVDMAVGIVIGAAFGKIATGLVQDVLMPPIGLLVGGVDFADLKLVLVDAAGDRPAVSVNYGTFLNTVIDFVIVAFAIFLLVKVMNRAKEKATKAVEAPAPAAPPSPTPEVALLTEIRDLLKSR